MEINYIDEWRKRQIQKLQLEIVKNLENLNKLIEKNSEENGRTGKPKKRDAIKKRKDGEQLQNPVEEEPY